MVREGGDVENGIFRLDGFVGVVGIMTVVLVGVRGRDRGRRVVQGGDASGKHFFQRGEFVGRRCTITVPFDLVLLTLVLGWGAVLLIRGLAFDLGSLGGEIDFTIRELLSCKVALDFGGFGVDIPELIPSDTIC